MTAQHAHDNCPACREEHYQQAKADPVASVVLDAMHAQDAATYNGLSEDMGQVALDAADKIRAAISSPTVTIDRSITTPVDHADPSHNWPSSAGGQA